MGSPDFAVAPLKKLLDYGCHLVGVITAPDRPAGRGKKIRQSAVKEFLLAHSYDIPILQPKNLKDPGFVNDLKELSPDLQVVVAFRMLPEVVWRIPSMGTLNLHASLLPQYRGAAPINHVIINGEKESGVTTFLIDEKIDTGQILLQAKTHISEKETAGELHDRLRELGSDLVLKTVNQMAAGTLKARSQKSLGDPNSVLHKAPKIFKEDCRILWDLPGVRIVNLIRGLSPYPGAFTILSRQENKLLCKIYSASFKSQDHAYPPGSILTDNKRKLEVAVADGIIEIHSLQLEGKRKMDVAEFLAGNSLSSGQSLFS
jgi:methionyl-tRNA formyltransferase